MSSAEAAWPWLPQRAVKAEHRQGRGGDRGLAGRSPPPTSGSDWRPISPSRQAQSTGARGELSVFFIAFLIREKIKG